jgi:hypothetical protein
MKHLTKAALSCRHPPRWWRRSAAGEETITAVHAFPETLIYTQSFLELRRQGERAPAKA